MSDSTETVEAGALLENGRILFRRPDPDRVVAGVRLFQEIRRPRNGPDFHYNDKTRAWELRFPIPDADRLEYMIELTHPDGGSELIRDPHNTSVAPGPFGDKSVLELPGYSPPQWIAKTPETTGSIEMVQVKSRPLRTWLHALIWSPAGTEAGAQLPLIVAHDGPEYGELSSLVRFLDVMTGEGRIPPLRAALVPPADRDNAYSASAAYSRSFAHEIMPQLLDAAPTPHGRSMRMGMGASLGALAMLHVHRRSPATFGSLYLQSGSYFRQRFDKQESGFSRFRRISRFMGEVLTAEEWAHPITATLTCGTVEENLANNRATYTALKAQGYEVKLVANRDGHNWVGWRDTFDPHLVDLVNRMWGWRRDFYTVHSPAFGGEGSVIAYGHHGTPMIVFPSEQGAAYDYENNGMIGVVSHLIEEGRLKVYCVDSFDKGSWNDDSISIEERAARHGLYEDWIVNHVVPKVHDDCGGFTEAIVTGCSFGAYHAANFCLKRADLFPVAICQSGVYDPSHMGWGESGDNVYFNNPMAYVQHMDGDHLDWIRERVSILLIAGQGQWEDTTGALEGTKAFSHVLGSKGIRHEMDLWGHDVPHDWPSWRRQIAHHLPRFV